MSNINEFENENNYGNGGFASDADNNKQENTFNNAVQKPDSSAEKNILSYSGQNDTEAVNAFPSPESHAIPENICSNASDDFSAPEITEKAAPLNSHQDTSSAEIQKADCDTYSSQPTMQNNVQSSYSQYSRPIGESAGIRYDADKTSADGNYTWHYCQNGQPTHIVPVKKDRKVLKAVAVTLASVFAVGLIGFGIYFAVKDLRNISDFSEGEITGEKDNIVEYLPGNSGSSSQNKNEEFPVILPKNEQDSADTQTVVVTPMDDGTLSKQMIAVKCKPSSVGIEVSATTRSYFGSYKTSGVGSGFILTQDGYIATNNHVVEGAEEITVMLDDGTRHTAKIIGADSVTDLAVIKIEAEGLIPMEIGDSDIMKVGDSVIAIGTPAGIEFAGTVTDGIISAVNRPVEVQGTNGYTKTMTLMQTNAAINPGNSGGPLINNKGEVIGINTLKLTEEYEGIGFSIPINSAIAIFNQLIKDGKVTDYEQSFVTGTGAIGITNYFEVTEEESKYYGIPVGVMVIQLKPGSSAQAAGLKRGDIITGFNGQKVKTVEEINKLKASFKAGDEVTLTIYRDPTEIIDITFKLDVMG